MANRAPVRAEAAARVAAWRHRAQAAVCDLLSPWAHGTIARSSRYPDYFDFNVLRVEDEPRLTVSELISFADVALAGLAHRRVDFDLIAAGQPRLADFEAQGWKATRLLWMRHQEARPPELQSPVRPVGYDAVSDLRRAWHGEDFPDRDASRYRAQAREVALRRGAQVLAIGGPGGLVGFAQCEQDGDGAEITQVYVDPDHRGTGRGTALVRAAIAAAGEVTDLWICADDEDRPKQLYARLGFRPAATTIEFLREP